MTTKPVKDHTRWLRPVNVVLTILVPLGAGVAALLDQKIWPKVVAALAAVLLAIFATLLSNNERRSLTRFSGHQL
ncbi:hypothetical protein [Microbacterium paludicola]|uniref:hypothetical protein n=1 Tax=Microbacterium paludicola TaxID=300019 RepID=UPI0031D8D9CC